MPAVLPPPPVNVEIATPRERNKGNQWGLVWGVAIFVVITGLAVMVTRTPHDPVAAEGLSPDFCKQHPNAITCGGPGQTRQQPAPVPVASPPAETPVDLGDPATLRTLDPTALKAVRETWIKTQQELWREGMEMTFQAHGTTLYTKYVLAGDAFAFQFHETFLGQNGATLKALGFKRVELSNGDHVWSWDLAQY